MRVPKHIGIIPDGNRRWAEANKMTKEKGYERGIDLGLILFHIAIGVSFQMRNHFYSKHKFISR